MLNEFDISYELLGRTFIIRVAAADLDAAWAIVEKMSVMDLIKDKTLGDFGCVFSGSPAQ